MTYTDEYKLLSDLNHCFNDGLEEIDITLYELINRYIDNPFNISAEDLKQLEEFIDENKKEEVLFNIETLDNDKNTLSTKFNHIKPLKLNKPIAPIKRMYGKCETKTVIPIYTDAKKLELKLAA